ncbi:carboxypeptidase regulatory-like domain-containing protein [Roseivirga sp. BDSF3-8]|uniref:TonB-dependent receptor n=1 Tax=Roseivirga sp. BDSF3-8 TaxID=3241598 RepID=UPI00353180E1
MRQKRLLINFFLTAMFVLVGQLAIGQGVTTGTITGVVHDASGEGLPGANVVAVHQPSGTTYGASTRLDGRFTLPNVRVGGPYKITATFVGFEDQVINNINVAVGQNLSLDINMDETATELAEVEVYGERDNILNSERTGAETKVSEEDLTNLPTISRDLNDFARLTPQASTTGSGISVAGINNRFNSIYIDGAVNNDVFGLAASGTNGGQTGISPISLDAVEELSVVVAPYDVRLGGFAGGGLNAVTRAGTNEFEGSAYYFFRNQDFTGKTPGELLEDGEEGEKIADFTSKIYGFRVGGPVIKDKLFFFVNGEIERREQPNPFSLDRYNGNATRAELDNLRSFLINNYNYDPGTYESNVEETNSDKILARLDWNINQNNKLKLRHSYTYGENYSPSNSSNSSINFANSGVFFPSTTNSTALELNSTFGNFSNNLILGYTTVRDDRDPIGGDFPNIFFDDENVTIGSEPFSTGNQLDQDIFTITDNFTWYKGNHTVTVGTHNEFYSIYNLFIRRAYGNYTYFSIDEFLAGVSPTEYRRQYSLLDDVPGDGSAAGAEFNAFQLGFYVQDEFYATDRLKLTGGLRMDIPVFSDEPVVDENFNNNVLPELAQYYDLNGAQAGQLPSSKVMFSPRLGFNWDVNGDRSTQVRGGLGVFTSRLPFVWLGGAFTNSGVILGEVRERGDFNGGRRDPISFPNGDPVAFRPDVNNQYTNGDFGGSDVAGGQIDLFAEDFKLPQVFRASVAVDQQLPGGIIGTLEFLYTKTINNVNYTNINKLPPTELMNGEDDRPVYGGSITGEYEDVLLATNTNRGYTYNLTAQLQKNFESGLSLNTSYTFGRAMALNDGTSSQNSSQWRYMENVNGRNRLDLSYSDFDLGHRVIAAASYSKEYLNNFRSTISMFYNGQSGQRYSYIYEGNVNGEDFSSADLIYVPSSLEDSRLVDILDSDDNVVVTAEEQWQALNKFIDGDDYLSSRRGQYAERNGSRLPFTNILDLRFLQDFYIELPNGKRNTLQFSVDIFNFTNLLNKDWGTRYFTSNDNFELIRVVNDGEDAEFNYIYDGDLDIKNVSDNGSSAYGSRWQMQLGLRYIFN